MNSLKNTIACNVLILSGLCLAACETHLMFVEGAHTGLRIKLSTDGSVPVDFNVGYKRGVTAFIPQTGKELKGEKGESLKGGLNSTESGEKKSITVTPGPGELTSLYNRFEANIGYRDPTYVRQILATGIAADNLAADPSALDNLWEYKEFENEN